MAKATTTIQHGLQYHPRHAVWFAATQDLFNRVAAFYFEVIQAHEGVLDLSNKEALTALETLTHATRENPAPVMPLSEIAQHVPAMFRRAAIHAALGSARSFFAHLAKWRAKKEKAQAKGKKFSERPPVPLRTWNKSATLDAGQWEDRRDSSILLKLWTGTCWSWLKVRMTGRELPADIELGSPSLVRHGKQWWLHTPHEAGQPAEGYTSGAPLVLCPQCGMQGHADRNASLVIGQRLIARYQHVAQEKPPTPLATERVAKATGVVLSQDPESKGRPSTNFAWHGEGKGHGTAPRCAAWDGRAHIRYASPATALQ